MIISNTDTGLQLHLMSSQNEPPRHFTFVVGTSSPDPVHLVCYRNRHYNDVTMRAMASQITGFSIVYSTVGSGADQRKHQSSASLAFVRGIHRWPVNSPRKRPVTRKMFPLDDVIMIMAPHLWCWTFIYFITHYHSSHIIEQIHYNGHA